MNGEIVSGGGRRKADPPGERPLSDLLAAGWGVGGYVAAASSTGLIEHSFHLQRGAENKLLLIRRKMMGEGLHAEEFDI